MILTSSPALNCHIRDVNLSGPGGAFLDDVSPRLTSYGHTLVATGGYESADLTFAVADLDEALVWLERLLCGVTVYDGDASLVWDGYIAAVSAQVGGARRAISLDPVANRARVRYTTALGVATATAQASDADSQARYGVRDAVLSLDRLTQAEAEDYRSAHLARYARPRATSESEVRTGADAGAQGPQVTLACAGWYTTLGWVTLERTDQTQEAVTAQVAALLGSASPGIGAINAFLSTDVGQIVATGRSATRAIPADTTYRDAIERRLALGSTGGERYAWGVFDATRRLAVRAWAGAQPEIVTYRTRMGRGVVEDGDGRPVPLWLVQPDAMVEDADAVGVGPVSERIDSPVATYRERVSFRMDGGGMALTFEPEASDSLTARLARLS